GRHRLGDRRNPAVGPRQLDDERPGGRALRGQVGRLQDAPPARQRRTTSEYDSPTKKISTGELHRALPGRPSSSWDPDLPRSGARNIESAADRVNSPSGIADQFAVRHTALSYGPG